MMSKLITPTLLDSIDWYNKCPPSWKQKAFNDLNGTLNRVPWEPNEEIKRGMAFEALICENLHKPLDEFLAVFDKCPARNDMNLFYSLGHEKNGALSIQQRKLKRYVTVDGVEYLVFGKEDLFRFGPPRQIIDIKTTHSYKGASSYLNKNQHVLYTFGEKGGEFIYAVAEFDDSPHDLEGKERKELVEYCTDVHIIDATLDLDYATEETIKRIRNAMHFIESDSEFAKAYHTKFNMFG